MSIASGCKQDELVRTELDLKRDPLFESISSTCWATVLTSKDPVNEKSNFCDHSRRLLNPCQG